MYARVLRKWSLTKFLMYLWLPVIIMLVICCPNATSMPLSINTKSKTTTSPTTMIKLDDTSAIDDHQYNDDHHKIVDDVRYGSKNIINNYVHRQPYEVFIKSSIVSNPATNLDVATNVINVPNLNSQIINLNDNYNYNSDAYSNLSDEANMKILRENRANNSINSNSKQTLNNHEYKLKNQLQLQPNFTLTPLYYNKQRIEFLYTKKQTSQNRKSLKTSPTLASSLSWHNFRQNINTQSNEYRGRTLLPFSNRNDEPIRKNIRLMSEENPIIVNQEQQLIITNNKNSLEQREKRARKQSHHRRLMRLKQLPTSSNYNNRNPSEINNKLTTIATATTGAVMDNDLNKLMIGRNRRDSRSFSSRQTASLSLLNQRHFQHQQQERRRSKRYCSARDPTQLAFEAPTVFEGKIKSMSYDRRANFSVTFEVKEIYKCQLDYKLPELLRLQFTYSNTSGECDIYREHLRPRGIVHEELEQGRVYILFVKQISKGNFTILGQPVKRTRRAVNAVRTGVSEKYAQPASIKSLTANRTANKVIVRDGDSLRLLCKVTGQPPPKVTWFKDGKSISRNRSKPNSSIYQFVHLKKRSELIVRSFNSTYAGLYECRAKNKVHKRPAKETIRVEAFSRNSPPSDETSFGGECPGDMQSYCLNGATCRYFRDIHEKSCVCPEGYNGERCQEKTTTLNTSTYQKEHQQCESFKGGFYC